MHTKFKRHQMVKILREPNYEYAEFKIDKPVKIEVGSIAKINILLPNGKYHIAILDKKGKIVAYVPMDEEDLESLD